MHRLVPPQPGREKDRWEEQLLQRLGTDINRLWRRVPTNREDLGIYPGNPTASLPVEGSCLASCSESRVFTIGMAGVTGTCCSQFNRTWVLTHVGSCKWLEIYDPGQCDPGGGGTIVTRWQCRLEVINPFPNDVTVLFEREQNGSFGTTRFYRIPQASFNCSGVSVSGNVSSGGCSGWPLNINVTGS